jgi:hypothetical protein
MSSMIIPSMPLLLITLCHFRPNLTFSACRLCSSRSFRFLHFCDLHRYRLGLPFHHHQMSFTSNNRTTSHHRFAKIRTFFLSGGQLRRFFDNLWDTQRGSLAAKNLAWLSFHFQPAYTRTRTNCSALTSPEPCAQIVSIVYPPLRSWHIS